MTCERMIANASPLIFLSKVEGLEWLVSMTQYPVLIPQAVILELEAGRGGMDLINDLQKNPKFSIVPNIPLPKEVAAWDLGSGESQVLSQCWEKPQKSCAILDDLAARKCAKGVGSRVLGTLGIVIIAKKKGLIPLVRPVIELLQSQGMFLSKDLIQSIIHDAEE